MGLLIAFFAGAFVALVFAVGLFIYHFKDMWG